MYKIIGADGKEYGPISLQQMKQWLAEGRLNLQSKVLPEGETNWKTLAEIPDIANAPLPPNVPRFTPVTPTADIPNYLWQSIVITLCCCLPFGVVAIIYAAQVKSKAGVGDIAGAQEASAKAKMWCWIGLGVGIVVNVLAILFQIFIAAAAGSGDL